MLESSDRQVDEEDAVDGNEAVADDGDEPGPRWSSPLVGWTFIALFIGALIVAGLMLT